MPKAPTPDYNKENKRRREAIDRENEFLKEEVIGQGADRTRGYNKQNIQSNIERSVDESEPIR